MFDLLIVVRAVHFAATMTAAGAVFFRFFIAEPVFAATPRRVERAAQTLRSQWTSTIWAALVVAVLSLAAWLVLFAADVYGAPISEVCLHGGVSTVLTETRFGQVCIIRLGLSVLLALTVALPISPATLMRWRIVPLAMAALLLASPAWTGHAGATAGLSGRFHLTADVLHFIAAGAWVGGLLPLAMVFAFGQQTRGKSAATLVSAMTSRFSTMGIASVGVLLLTGIINSWYLVGTLDSLFASTYGRLVLAKIGVFTAMVAIAAINKFHLTPRLPARDAARQLHRNSLTEAAFGLVAVCLVGALGTIAPTAHDHSNYGPVPDGAAFVHIHTEQAMAEVTITPGRAGAVTLTLRLMRGDFTPLAAKQVGVRLSNEASGNAPISRVAVATGDGNWRVEKFDLPRAGVWTVQVDIVSQEFGRTSIDGPIVIDP